MNQNDVRIIIKKAMKTEATTLDLSGKSLTALPPEIGQMTQLTELYLSGNQLTALPPEVGKLTQLKLLYLGRNQLTALPPEIGQLSQLTELSLEGNQLTALPPELVQLSQLTDLALGSNQLTALPPEIGRLTQLTKLDLSDNKLKTLPPEIGQLNQLAVLNLGGNRLAALPSEIGRLNQLTKLSIAANRLTALPPEIGQLTQLTRLHIYSNLLKALPPEIGQLTQLPILSFLKNRLTALPPEIGRLTQLMQLDIRRNRLTALPPEIGQLSQLTQLDLGENQLTALPPEIGKLKSLEKLSVIDNPLPAEILKLAEEGQLIAYLREMAQKGPDNVRRFDEAKLLLVGPGKVGKTWLLQAMQGKIPVDVGSTKGIEIARQPLELPHPSETGRTIHFNCWDFGGQDHYQVTHQIFFSPKAIYLIVWNPRTGIDPGLEAQLERIELSARRTAKVFIVSTHADGGIPAVVVGEQALCERFGELIGGFHKVDSAKGPKGRGIAKLKRAIAKAAAQLEGMDTPYPATWHAASAALRKMETPTLPFARFAAECGKQGMSAETAEALALIMDVQGHAVFFADAAGNGGAGVSGDDNLVVLDPEWLAKAVAMVLEDKPTLKSSGVLEHARLPEIWKQDNTRGCPGYDGCLCGYLLWMMWKFEIAYRMSEQTSLVPQLIQRNQPDDLRWTPATRSREPQAVLIGRIPHDPPPGLVALLTAAVHPLRRRQPPEDPLDRNWRNGFFLDTARRGTAFVELQDRDLRMTVRDNYPGNLLRMLRNTLDNAAKARWENLALDYCVPCPSRKNDKACRGSFLLSYLEPRRGKMVSCQHCGNDEIEVDKLLDGYDLREEQIMEALRRLEAGQVDMMAEQHDLMALALRMYRDVLDPARGELERAPCMISILPDKAGRWDLLGKATKQYYRVTCWCEHPDGPHPGAEIGSGEAPDYRLEMPREWLVKAAPYVTWFALLAKTFLPLAGKVADEALGGRLDKTLKEELDYLGELVKTLPAGALEVGRRDELELGHRYRPEIVALRHLHDTLLARVSPEKRWGDLRPVRTRAHGVIWLCRRHAEIQDPPVPEIGEKDHCRCKDD